MLFFPACGWGTEPDAARARIYAPEPVAGPATAFDNDLPQFPQLVAPVATRQTSEVQLLPPSEDAVSSASGPEISNSSEIEREPLHDSDSQSAHAPPSLRPSLYGEGLEISFWGWLSYIASPQLEYSTFWAWEGEIDITKSFTECLAASADFDFEDTDDDAEANIEQLFVSILFPSHNDAILTAGKFNAPFGVERRDFWDRETGSTSLLFRAQPRDLVGLMYTQPCNAANLTFRTFVVNGFDDNLDTNRQPSIGLMVEHRMCEDFCVALTNWWGPEFEGNNDDKLYFTEVQANWQITPRLSFAGEFLYGTTDSPAGSLDYTGFLTILSYSLCDRWRLFGQWSDLNDRDGFILFVPGHRSQVSTGLAWELHSSVEARVEYRHDFIRNRIGSGRDTDNVDQVSAHLTFGY
jgi:hypothetical protein